MRAGPLADDLAQLRPLEVERRVVVGRVPGWEDAVANEPRVRRPPLGLAVVVGAEAAGEQAEAPPSSRSSGPNESVTESSNQQFAPALQPPSTAPRFHASRSARSTPWTRQSASAFAVLPPET